jgi:transposase InsO family protein
MICAHSSLACPFCRCRISTWLRHNPDYSKFIIKRESKPRKTKKKIVVKQQQQPKRRYQTSKPKPTSKDKIYE